jgi:hypothetical protein
MKIRVARREFLRRCGQAAGLFVGGSFVAESILDHLFRKAFADTIGAGLNPSGYYVHLSFIGGPPRWCFDLPLTPAGKTAANFMPGGFGTVIHPGASPSVEYVVQKHTAGTSTLYLPPVWNMKLAQQDFSSLLPNTCFIRGMHMEIDNHIISNQRQTSPIVGGYTIGGVVADRSERPIPAVADPSGSFGQLLFKSQKHLMYSAINYAQSATVNPISTMLSPFKNYFANRAVHTADRARLQQQALEQFENYATERGLATSSLSAMYDGAMDLIEANIFDLAGKWSSTIAKYNGIMQEALVPKKGSLPGLFDKAIAPTSSPMFRFTRTDDLVKVGDVRDVIQPGLASAHFAENFAIAEILIDKVTANFDLAFSTLTGLNSGSSVKYNHIHDQHFIGSVLSTLVTTLYYRAFLGCLTEFVGSLKKKGIFERTVIHISSEFNRTPLTDGSGSNHGYMGSNATLVSGMIGEMTCVGNIQKADYASNYKGTFGIAKPFVSDGFNRPIQVNDVALTITSMLGVDSIVTNGRSLLKPASGKWVAKKKEADNV